MLKMALISIIKFLFDSPKSKSNGEFIIDNKRGADQ